MTTSNDGQLVDGIEDRLRATYSAVIDRDPERFQKGLTGIAATGTEGITQALNYSLYVIGYVVADVLPQDDRGQETLTEMAQDIKNGTQDWIDVGSLQQITGLLQTALAMRREIPDVEPGDVGGDLFVIGGYLLARYRHEGQQWWEFLDAAWDALNP